MKDRYYSSLEENVLPSQKPEYAWFQCQVDEGGEEEQEEEEPIVEMLVGKWMIFYKSMSEADELWPILKKALYSHELGPTMKSATEPSRNGVLICIYTDDWYNIADNRRVLQALRKLGRQEKIYYKANAQTVLGISGSIYVSPDNTLIEVTKKGYEWFKFMNRSIPEMQQVHDGTLDYAAQSIRKSSVTRRFCCLVICRSTRSTVFSSGNHANAIP